ncbi:MAG TPA: septal ring lytic transglycosylase RlpA family protein [Nevskiales bacterium]|nr:septal ring lytic transglycosylase RlpA family protein [Nevskiales bacterium]
MHRPAALAIVLAAAALSACGSTGGVRKDEPYRRAPVAPGDDAPRSKYGNPESYEVDGKTYRVLDTARGYRERGLASWYGEDFHGKRTSSGEPYNMHAMTAAHRTLPLPSYVRVTNLQNRREVIVRVNDRGPFHDDRIIDLSFAAATELGIVRDGTAEVEVTAVDPVLAAASMDNAAPPPRPAPAVTAPAPPLATSPSVAGEGDALAPDEIPVVAQRRVEIAPAPVVEPLSDETMAAAAGPPLPVTAPLPAGDYLQAGAFSEARHADALVERLRRAGFANATAYPLHGLLKVRLGPYADLPALERDRERLQAMGIRALRVEKE